MTTTKKSTGKSACATKTHLYTVAVAAPLSQARTRCSRKRRTFLGAASSDFFTREKLILLDVAAHDNPRSPGQSG
jgi:hypothetical protein